MIRSCQSPIEVMLRSGNDFPVAPNLLNLFHLMIIDQISSRNQSKESPSKRHIDQHSIKATVAWQLANVHSVHIHFSFYPFPLDQRTRSQIFISSFLFRFSFLPSHILTIISSLLHIHFRTLLMNMSLTKTPNLKSTKGFEGTCQLVRKSSRFYQYLAKILIS